VHLPFDDKTFICRAFNAKREELRFPTAVVRYFILSAVPFLYGRRMQQLLRTSLDVNFKAYQKALLWFFLLAASTESSKRLRSALALTRRVYIAAAASWAAVYANIDNSPGMHVVYALAAARVRK
jgi:hypothetical protein